MESRSVRKSRYPAEEWLTRALTWPVSRPLEPDDWDALRCVVELTAQQCRNAANAVIRRLACAEAATVDRMVRKHRKDKKEQSHVLVSKLIPMAELRKRLGTTEYRVVHECCPDFSSYGTGPIANFATDLYTKFRRMMVTGNASLPSVRQVPIPVRASGVAFRSVEVGSHCAIKLPIGDRKWTLLLKGGKGFQRHRETFAKIASSEWPHGEVSLLHTPGKPLLVKIVYKRPMPEKRERTGGPLHVYTHPAALLVAWHSQRDQVGWWWNGDNLVAARAAHERRMQRLREDRKHGLRERRRKAIDQKLAELSRRRMAREKTEMQQCAAALAAHAAALACEAVVWHDDPDCRRLPMFGYAELRQHVANKLEELGIALRSPAQQQAFVNQEKWARIVLRIAQLRGAVPGAESVEGNTDE